ncbi:response regulator [Frateuria defendens]|uniref:response regulator n=1 Tax=Frateuria defendens TaxID=2219559 RepID=UPI00066FF046|nr:response regulator transcription factor [Frateuria defendens]
MAEPDSFVRVLVVDDHPVMRDGLRAMITGAPGFIVAGEACNGEEAVTAHRRLAPDVVLMDLQMPHMDGLQATAAIREECPAARIVVLTTYPGDARVTRALALGATSYLLKMAPREEILMAIAAAVEGRRHIAGAAASEVALHAGDEHLTARELCVLRLVALGRKNRSIAGLLSISEETVKARIRNILAKLGAADRTHAVTIAMRRGFLDA